MSDQLALFDLDTKKPITFVQMCHVCGEPICGIPIDNVGDSWNPGVLFGYCALKTHLRDVHGRESL